MTKDTAPAGIIINDQRIEFFMLKGELCFSQGGSIYPWSDLSIDIAGELFNLLKNDAKAIIGLNILRITDPNERLKQFTFCRFGGLDSIPDLDDGKASPEYWDCGNRPCPADGFLCKLPPVLNGKLTIHDALVIREISKDLPNKIIADDLHASVHTINTECKIIAQKIGCHTQKGIASYAGKQNII
jgi:DNA-binding CsgD family transcriptional regulator